MVKKYLKKLKDVILTSFRKINNNKWHILKILTFILLAFGTFTVIFWVMNIFIRFTLELFFDNFIWIGLITFFISQTYHYLYNQRQERLNLKQQRKINETALELEHIEHTAKNNYYYLKMFLFEILDSRLCSQLELFKPQTPELLQDLKPIQIEKETGIVYYNFVIEKESEQPLSRGNERVKHILTSVIMNKIKSQGINGITPPTNSDPTVILYVHKIIDRGLNLQITLVLNNEAYKKHMEQTGESTEEDFIEHI